MEIFYIFTLFISTSLVYNLIVEGTLFDKDSQGFS